MKWLLVPLAAHAAVFLWAFIFRLFKRHVGATLAAGVLVFAGSVVDAIRHQGFTTSWRSGFIEVWFLIWVVAATATIADFFMKRDATRKASVS